jgi:hypothetical protein
MIAIYGAACKTGVCLLTDAHASAPSNWRHLCLPFKAIDGPTGHKVKQFGAPCEYRCVRPSLGVKPPQTNGCTGQAHQDGRSPSVLET